MRLLPLCAPRVRCRRCPQFASHGLPHPGPAQEHRTAQEHHAAQMKSPSGVDVSHGLRPGARGTEATGSGRATTDEDSGWGGSRVRHCENHRERGEEALVVVMRQWRRQRRPMDDGAPYRPCTWPWVSPAWTRVSRMGWSTCAKVEGWQGHGAEGDDSGREKSLLCSVYGCSRRASWIPVTSGAAMDMASGGEGGGGGGGRGGGGGGGASLKKAAKWCGRHARRPCVHLTPSRRCRARGCLKVLQS